VLAFQGVVGVPLGVFCLEDVMRPVKRYGVDKGQSARQFRGNVSRTKGANMRAAPMRGGIRL